MTAAGGEASAVYRMRFESTQIGQQTAVDYLTLLYEAALKERGSYTASQARRFETSVDEITINAFVHGNSESFGKSIRVSFTETPGAVVVTVSDESGKFFDGLDPNERVNRLRLRALSLEDSQDTDGLIERRLAAGHALNRQGDGGRGILLAGELGAQMRYLPHTESDGKLIGTTVQLRFPFDSGN